MLRPARFQALRIAIAFAMTLTLGLQGMLLSTKAGLAAAPHLDGLRILCLGGEGPRDGSGEATDHGGSLSCLAACVSATIHAGPAPEAALQPVALLAYASAWEPAGRAEPISRRDPGQPGPRAPPVSA